VSAEQAGQPMVYVAAPQPSGFVVDIGPKQIYDQLLELKTEVRVMTSVLQDLVKQHEDHEQRLRALERNRWPMHLVTALIALLAFLASVFDFKVGK
jgi:hypothetical protein